MNEDPIRAITPRKYPDREKFFSHRFVRLLTKMCVAQEIGTAAAWLLAVIVHQEDAFRYRQAVTFWDGQLAPLIGAKSVKTFRLARTKAVELGWLHYEPGSKGRVAKYWVLIPQYASDLDDGPIDDGDDRFRRDECEVNFTPHRERNGDASGTKGICKGTPFIPNPIPVPKERTHFRADGSSEAIEVEERKNQTKLPISIPFDLQCLIEAWNELPPEIASRVSKPDSAAIVNGWKKVQKDSEASLAFKDTSALMGKIRGSPFLHGQGWFQFTWLFKKDSDRTTWNILKVINGNYEHSTRSPSVAQSTGRHDESRPVADTF